MSKRNRRSDAYTRTVGGVNYPHAFMWLSIAAERGSIVASDNRAKIEKKMSGDELRAAATLLEQCRSRNFIKYE